MIAQHLTSGCFRDANWDRGSGTASIEDEKSVSNGVAKYFSFGG